MSSKPDPIIVEANTENSVVPPRECVSCGKEQSIVDISTQAVQEEAPGMHCCQTCLPLSVADVAPEIFSTE